MFEMDKKKFRKMMSVFLSFSTFAWSLGVTLSALILLAAVPKPVLAAAPTVEFVEIEPGTGSQSVRIGFSEEVDQTTAQITTNYVLYIGATPYAANSATKSTPTSNVVVSFATALDAITITPGTGGDTINISNVEDDSTNTAMTAVEACVVAPAQSIKTDADSGDVTLQIKPTTCAPKKTETIEAANDGTATVTPTIAPITTEAQEVTAEDTSGPISTLSSSINIEFDYDDYDAEIITAIEADPTLLTCQYLNEANQWESTEAVSNDTTNHVLTCTTSHLSVYAPSIPSNILAPGTPAGTAASAGSEQVTITWTKNSESDMHHYSVWETEVTEGEVGTATQASCGASTCTYTHSSLSNGTTYEYQIMAVDNDGYISAGSTTVTASPAGGGAGVASYIPPTTQETEEETTETETPEVITPSPTVTVKSYPNGALLKVKGDPTIWLIEDSMRKGIPSAGIFESRFKWESIVEILSNDTLGEYAIGEAAKYPDGTLLASASGTVYAISEGKKRGITSPEIFEELGYKWENVIAVSNAELEQYPDYEGSNIYFLQGLIESADSHPVGALVNINGTVYKKERRTEEVNPGEPVCISCEVSVFRGIPTPNVFLTNNFSWENVVPATEGEISLINSSNRYIGQNLSFPDGTIIREEDKLTVYVVADGKKRGFTSSEVFENKGYKWDNIVVATAEEVATLVDGDVME